MYRLWRDETLTKLERLKFSVMCLRHLVPWPSVDFHRQFTDIIPGETLRRAMEGLNARGVAKYSDFGPVESYISETVQDRRLVSVNY